MEQGRRGARASRSHQGRTPRRGESQGLRRRDVLGVRQLHAGAEWDVYEVRYVWVHDGVFVIGLLQNSTIKRRPPERAAFNAQAGSMGNTHPRNCGCAICSGQKPFTPPDHLLSAIAAGDVVLFVGAGISTENRTYCQSTFYDQIRAELNISDSPAFPELLSMYCKQSDGRIRLLEKIKSRIDFFLSFDDLYRPMARFHRAISPLFMITDVITTNWDDLFQQECRFSPFVYDSDIAFWDAARR